MIANDLLLVTPDQVLSFMYPLSYDGFYRAYVFIFKSYCDGWYDEIKLKRMIDELDDDFENFDIISFMNFKRRFYMSISMGLLFDEVDAMRDRLRVLVKYLTSLPECANRQSIEFEIRCIKVNLNKVEKVLKTFGGLDAT